MFSVGCRKTVVSSLVLQTDFFSAENEIIPLLKTLLHISGFLTERFSFVQELLTYAGAIVNNTLKHFSSFFHFDQYSQRLLFSNLSFKKSLLPPFLPPLVVFKGETEVRKIHLSIFRCGAHDLHGHLPCVCARAGTRASARLRLPGSRGAGCAGGRIMLP